MAALALELSYFCNSSTSFNCILSHKTVEISRKIVHAMQIAILIQTVFAM